MKQPIHNAKIESTMLGFEGHGIFSFMIHVEWEGHHSQGFGGYSLGGEFTNDVIKGILKTVDVEKWEDLRGSLIRIKHESDAYNSRIVAIGNIISEKWFDLPETAKKHEKD